MRGLFEVGQHFGINILPNHFYSSIPDIRVLKGAEHWRQPFAMDHVAGATLSEQIAFLEDLCPPSLSAQWLDVYGDAERENAQGGGYGVIEAEILHAFVRRHQPRRVVQVGCGVSTSVILRAASLAGYKTRSNLHRTLSIGVFVGSACEWWNNPCQGGGGENASRNYDRPRQRRYAVR